jgi:hypothetical protein
MQCFYCHWNDDKHDANCPKMADPSQREAAEATWRAGYTDGKNRRSEAQPNDPTYMIGWVRGNAFADYLDNVSE